MSSWFWAVVFLSFALSSSYLSEAKLRSAVVVGTVYCDTCFSQNVPKASHFIAGASVEIQCNSTSSRQAFRQEVKTDNHGEFKACLPFHVSKHVRKIRGCSVRLIQSNAQLCAIVAAASSSSLHLKSRTDDAHIFSAGFFSFRPLKNHQICDQLTDSKKEIDQLPFLPNPLNPPSIFPPFPNPLQPPPSVIPPILPSPPPSILPPIFPTPPPSIIPPILPNPTMPPPFFPLPPIPGLVPSPPPPPPPILPIPFPPFPFLPPPGFPGVPPADKASSQSRTSSP